MANKSEFEQDLKKVINKISKNVEIYTCYKTELKKEDLVKIIRDKKRI